jgi:hypothetical protein
LKEVRSWGMKWTCALRHLLSEQKS